jgi:hypothetical protein
LASRSFIFSFYSAVDSGPPGSAHHQRENVDDGPLGDAGAEGPEEPTTNVDSGPTEGAGAEGPGASTINVKTSMASPREVPELKPQERLPPM